MFMLLFIYLIKQYSSLYFFLNYKYIGLLDKYVWYKSNLS